MHQDITPDTHTEGMQLAFGHRLGGNHARFLARFGAPIGIASNTSSIGLAEIEPL
jgi:hypothetical protein